MTIQVQHCEKADPVQRCAAPATILPASADPDLIAQFDARVQRMFALLDMVLAESTPRAVRTLRDALHQLAGTAAFFGHATLGTVASEHNETLREAGDVATRADLMNIRDTLRDALAGEG